MEFTVDGNLAFEFLDWQRKLIKDYVQAKSFKSDMKRRAIHAVERPVCKYLTTHRDTLLEKLKNLGIERCPSNVYRFSEFIASRDDMDIEKTSFENGCSLECNGEFFREIPEYILTIAKSFVCSDDSYVEDRIKFIFNEKIKMSIKRMHFTWDSKLEERNLEIPIDDESFALLVFSQEDYR